MAENPLDPIALYNFIAGKVFDDVPAVPDVPPVADFVTKDGKKVKINGKGKVKPEQSNGSGGSNPSTGTHHTFEFIVSGKSKPRIKPVKPEPRAIPATEEEGEAEGLEEPNSDESAE